MHDLLEKPAIAPISPTAAVEIRNVSFSYGSTQALKDITLDLRENEVTAFIGPSGCGKSTLLRCINRMNDEIVGTRITQGEILVEGINIHHPSVDVVKLRRDVGMVFQKSNPFPSSIFENVAFGLRMRGERNKSVIAQTVEFWQGQPSRLHDRLRFTARGEEATLDDADAWRLERLAP